MSDGQGSDVTLRPWSERDLPLLERLMGDPAMMTHLGGPETPDKIRERHARYCAIADTGKGRVFVIVVGADATPVGSVAYWEREWHGELIWETGWSVLPEFQGRGFATRGTAAAVERARAEQKHRSIHAFPSVDNAPSNAICRKVGFTLTGEVEFEYPLGHFMRCNDWTLDLSAGTDAAGASEA
jgi:RimJ/RimL family protein N-acetyltransferase